MLAGEKKIEITGGLKRYCSPNRIQLYTLFALITLIPRMSSQTTYAPGTLFRIFTADNSKHYTALLLKDGQVLELKNPDTSKKETFPSLIMWRASHGATEDDVKVDASKGSGVVIGSDTNGFNYPATFSRVYRWVQWCYSIVKEAAPQLLKSEEFKLAYNNMVELCSKHIGELTIWCNYSPGINRYNPDNILISPKGKYRSEMSGFPGSFQYQYYSLIPYSGPGYKRYTSTDYAEASAEIGAGYVAIVNIIKPEIETYMSKKHKIIQTEKDICNKRAAIKRYEKKLSALQGTIDWYKYYIQKDTDALAKLQEEFITAKMADV